MSTRSTKGWRIVLSLWKLRWLGVAVSVTPTFSFLLLGGPTRHDDIHDLHLAPCRHSLACFTSPFAATNVVLGSFASTRSELHAFQSPRDKYSKARRVRIDQGPDASFELYRQLLHEFPDDFTTATRLAASPHAHAKLQNLFVHDDATNEQSDQTDRRALRDLRILLQRNGYTAGAVARRLLRLGSPSRSNDNEPSFSPLPRFTSTQIAQAPLFVTSAAAGTHYDYPWDDVNVDALDLLIALFLVGLAVPLALLEGLLDDNLRSSVRSPLADASDSPGGNNRVLVTCQANPGLVYSLVQIMPIDLSTSSDLPSTLAEHRNLWIMTDWHPRTLSLTTIREGERAARGQLREDTVMYIGPDSLALVQHWLDGGVDRFTAGGVEPPKSLLDLCTGSGIQAIVELRAHSCLERAVGVDVNPRAIRFAMANAVLNDVERRLELIVADLLSDQCYSVDNAPVEEGASLSSYLARMGGFDLVTANPPFLPVPPSLALSSRHGLFSDGGRTGEDVLAAVVRLSSSVLNPGGTLGVVSEFFLDANLTVITRIQRWWGDSRNEEKSESSVGVLLTNLLPLRIEEYAERRADDVKEYDEWVHHLHTLGVSGVSPGLLFIHKGSTNRFASSDDGTLVIHHDVVPKSSLGSVWTPSNLDAISYTSDSIRKHLN